MIFWGRQNKIYKKSHLLFHLKILNGENKPVRFPCLHCMIVMHVPLKALKLNTKRMANEEKCHWTIKISKIKTL